MTMVASIGNYGCQVWAVDYLGLGSEAQVLENPFQKVIFDLKKAYQ